MKAGDYVEARTAVTVLVFGMFVAFLFGCYSMYVWLQ